MINSTEYAKRRAAILKKMGENTAFIVCSSSLLHRNGDAHHAYRQDSDFYYLTGFNEPEAVLVLLPNRKEGEFVLFNRPRNRSEELWDGVRAGQDGARLQFGADESFPIETFSQELKKLLLNRTVLYYSLGLKKSMDSMIENALNALRSESRSGASYPSTISDVAPLLHEERLIKSERELNTIQKAVDISIEGHERAMKACKPNVFEYELEAELLHAFCRNGARSLAYTSIVGSGKNSCILHYCENLKRIEAGDLVLIDAGCEYNNYASDITRTFPANGRFSTEQALIYDLVLLAQEKAIACIRPGVLWDEPQKIIVDVLTHGLIDLGILHGNADELIEKKAYLPYYMHRSGHWLGLDVHDVGAYKLNQSWRSFEKGMVLTVEPGLYFSSDIPGLQAKWHNIGIRIEDDVVVTETGTDVLSKKLIKRKDDIEHFMR